MTLADPRRRPLRDPDKDGGLAEPKSRAGGPGAWRRDGAGSGAVTGGPGRCRWCPSRSATPGSRWGGSPSSSRSCAWLAYLVTWFFDDFFHPGYEGAVARTEAVLYLVIVTLLTVSALAYLLAGSGSSTARARITGRPAQT